MRVVRRHILLVVSVVAAGVMVVGALTLYHGLWWSVGAFVYLVAVTLIACRGAYLAGRTYQIRLSAEDTDVLRRAFSEAAEKVIEAQRVRTRGFTVLKEAKPLKEEE